MPLEEKLKKLSSSVPDFDKDLTSEIYKKSLNQKIIKKGKILYSSLASFFIIILLVFVGSLIYISSQNPPLSINRGYDNMGMEYNIYERTTIVGSNVYSEEEDIFIIKLSDNSVSKLYIESKEDEIKDIICIGENIKINYINNIFELDLTSLIDNELYIQLIYEKGTFKNNFVAYKSIFRFDNKPYYEEDIYKIEFIVYSDMTKENKKEVLYGFPKSKIEEGFSVRVEGTTNNLEKALSYLYSPNFNGSIMFKNHKLKYLQYERINESSFVRYMYGDTNYTYADVRLATRLGDELSEDDILSDLYKKGSSNFRDIDTITLHNLEFKVYKDVKSDDEQFMRKILITNVYKDGINQYMIIEIKLFKAIVNDMNEYYQNLLETSEWLNVDNYFFE